MVCRHEVCGAGHAVSEKLYAAVAMLSHHFWSLATPKQSCQTLN
jgi:hypothetical protein